MRAFVCYVLYLTSDLPGWLLVSMKVQKETAPRQEFLTIVFLFWQCGAKRTVWRGVLVPESPKKGQLLSAD